MSAGSPRNRKITKAPTTPVIPPSASFLLVVEGDDGTWALSQYTLSHANSFVSIDEARDTAQLLATDTNRRVAVMMVVSGIHGPTVVRLALKSPMTVTHVTTSAEAQDMADSINRGSLHQTGESILREALFEAREDGEGFDRVERPAYVREADMDGTLVVNPVDIEDTDS